MPDVLDAGQAALPYVQAMDQYARRIAQLRPKVIVTVCAHSLSYLNSLSILDADELCGSLAAFNRPFVRMQKPVSRALFDAFCALCGDSSHPAMALGTDHLRGRSATLELDFGIIVPLSFIDRYYTDYELLAIGTGNVGVAQAAACGRALAQAARQCALPTVVLCSADLSQLIDPTGAAQFLRSATLYDTAVCAALRSGDADAFFAIDPVLAQNAGECGRRAIAFGLGALDGHHWQADCVDPHMARGVSRFAAYLQPGAPGGGSFVDRAVQAQVQRNLALNADQDAYVRLARMAIRSAIQGQPRPPWQQCRAAMSEFEALRMEKHRAGVYVSLYRDARVQASAGSPLPHADHVGTQILEAAQNAGSRARFGYTLDEMALSHMQICVDIIGPMEPVQGLSKLDEKRYGVMVQKDGKSAVILPGTEEATSPARQVFAAARRAGLQRNAEGIKIYRFDVERHGRMY